MGRIGCVRLRKIPMRLRGTNFCTSSARFALSFVRRLNGPECTQKVRNAPKRQFRVQLGGSGTFVAKMHPNSTKRTKTSFYGPTGWIGCIRCEKFRRNFVARTFCTSSAHFVRRPNGPECTENSTKRTKTSV